MGTLSIDRVQNAINGGNAVYLQVSDAFRAVDPKGVHVESILCALGALAGCSCQAAVLQTSREKGLDEEQTFLVVECADGHKYFFGDNLNRPLAEDSYSVWRLATGAVHRLGVERLIDLDEIFRHVSDTLCGEDFGKVRFPNGHKASDTPHDYVKHFWPLLLPTLSALGPAEQWPIVLGTAVHLLILDAKDVIDPLVALSIVMESAIITSKIPWPADKNPA